MDTVPALTLMSLPFESVIVSLLPTFEATTSVAPAVLNAALISNTKSSTFAFPPSVSVVNVTFTLAPWFKFNTKLIEPVQ